jgi:hypothetical protein
LERDLQFDLIRDDPVFIDYLNEGRGLAKEQRQLLLAMREDASGN